jgi:acetyl-CoA carboxylase biotin carboxylase subunit
MFDKVLVANRGEIACRVIRTLRRLGIGSVAVYSDADAGALHVETADEAVRIGEPRPADSYLRADRIVRAALDTGAEAVHPGYGFLSENAAFARAVTGAGLTWIGPTPEVIEAVGNKGTARRRMAALGFPVNGMPDGESFDAARAEEIASSIGYPIMVKAAAGGGGIGMQVVEDAARLGSVIERTGGQAERLFGDGSVVLERYLPSARHVELQVLGLAGGGAVVVGERDCSVQRRFQKVVEESPAPGLSADLLARMHEHGRSAAEAMGYRNAGTIECLVAGEEFFFLEVNARLQVEHPVTEMVTGIDLVEEQLRIAAGAQVTPAALEPVACGHAIELRVYAEDPQRFLPAPGRIESWEMPSGEHVRVDAGYRAGDEVTPFYDPLLAKVCVWGTDRQAAIVRARDVLADVAISGPKTNVAFLREVLDHPDFAAGAYDTRLVGSMRP